MKFTKLWSLSAFTMLGLAACTGGGGGGGTGGGGGGGYVAAAWYNVYGSYCGSVPRPGCDFYSNGDKIDYATDPYYAPLTYSTWYYIDVYGYETSFTGYGRLTADNILFDQYGNALNSVQQHGKDMATNAAATEKASINGAAQALSAKYGLDANVSSNIANALNDWALIGKSRKRTDSDLAAFSKRLSGLDISEVNAAMAAADKGDLDAVDQAINKAAKNWSTSPDTMKQIIQDWFVNQTASNS